MTKFNKKRKNIQIYIRIFFLQISLSKNNKNLLGKNNNIDIKYFPSAKIWNFNSYSLLLLEELFHIHSIQLTWVWRALVLFIQNIIPNLLYDFGQSTLLFGFHLVKASCNIRLNFFFHTSGRGQKEKNSKTWNFLKKNYIILTSLAIHKLGMFAYAVHKMWNSSLFARNHNVEDLFLVCLLGPAQGLSHWIQLLEVLPY